jgi:hypothetical protein
LCGTLQLITSLNFTRFESTDGLSAIAMAIKENNNFKSLRLESCSLSTAQGADLNRLLADKGLEVFTLVECSSSSNEEVLCISEGLDTNQSLQTLQIDNDQTRVSGAAAAFGRMLTINTHYIDYCQHWQFKSSWIECLCIMSSIHARSKEVPHLRFKHHHYLS